MKFVFWRDRSQLPNSPGIYYCYRFFRLLYVGQSRDLRQRWTSNFGYGSHHKLVQLDRIGCTHITYRVIVNADRRNHEEAIVIKDRKPPLNIRQESVNLRLAWQDALYMAIVYLFIAVCLWRYALPMILSAIIGG